MPTRILNPGADEASLLPGHLAGAAVLAPISPAGHLAARTGQSVRFVILKRALSACAHLEISMRYFYFSSYLALALAAVAGAQSPVVLDPSPARVIGQPANNLAQQVSITSL